MFLEDTSDSGLYENFFLILLKSCQNSVNTRILINLQISIQFHNLKVLSDGSAVQVLNWSVIVFY